VERYVGVSSAGVEALADHERSLPMRHRARPDAVHIGGQGHMPETFFQTYWNASVAPQMFAPPPITLNSLLPSNSTAPFLGGDSDIGIRHKSPPRHRQPGANECFGFHASHLPAQ
jgi:hypothetical protein